MTQPLPLSLSLPTTGQSSSKKSILGKTWCFSDVAERDVLTLMQAYDLSEIVARILVNRGYTLEGAAAFLSPSLNKMLPNPSLLKGMDQAAKRTATAIINGESIAVFGDYDVDGATSSALLRRYIALLGLTPRLYIPDRIEEGYGPSTHAMETLSKEGHTLILMVDCGTLSFVPLKHAKDLGMDVIVLDHHMSDIKLPEVFALVNPNRIDEEHGIPYLGQLCAAGVTFLFLVALQRELRLLEFFKERNEPDLRLFLDLVALGTVCDVMPLTHLNRVFVSHGLTLMKQRRNVGVTALLDVSKLTHEISSYHIGFVMGPRVNAGGRVGESWYGSDLLTTDDPVRAREIAGQLDKLNYERQQLEKNIIEEAMERVESENLSDRPLILVGSDAWHPGVIGIVASRLMERFQRPALVTSFMFGEEGKGSGRSISTVNLGLLMHQAVEKNLILKGGGHPMAAGFTVHKDRFDEFYDFLCSKCLDGVASFEPKLHLEGWLTATSVTSHLIKDLSSLEPFGQGHDTPRFALSPVDIVFVETFGQGHIRLTIKDESGTFLKGVCFRAQNTKLGDFLLTRPKGISVAGTLREDLWNGKVTLAMTVMDAAE